MKRALWFWLSSSTACLVVAVAAVAGTALHAQRPPQTTPERTEYRESSRPDEVAAFLAACRSLPHGDRLRIDVAGHSGEGRDLQLVHVALPGKPPAPLRVLIIGDIHAGEVEGKEALQLLVREFASGEHAELLAHCEAWLLPIYNVDGAAAIGPHRPGQNGPSLVGKRETASGLDLNRDFVKADAPETRVLLRLFHDVDPHLFIDLHTTNGSYHGYHLTYAPCLSPNMDPQLAALNRALLDAAQAAMQRDFGYATFDYGNFETQQVRSDAGAEPSPVRGWFSYDHRARYGINQFGLRNRLAVLSEAYSYCDFATRIAATRAFVLCLLRGLVARGDDIVQATAAADERLRGGAPTTFGFATTFAPPEPMPVLVGEVDEIPADGDTPLRRARREQSRAETMPVSRSFVAHRHRELPDAWAIRDASPELVQRLSLHGIAFTTLAAPESRHAQRFAVSRKRKPKQPYQGHQELVLVGEWDAPAAVELPAGTVVVSARQRLARLCAQLLEPESEDSLSTWNFFEATTDTHYPVLRVLPPPAPK